QAGNIRGTAEPHGGRLRNPGWIRISAGRLPGALTASGQHNHRPFPRPGEGAMRSPLKALLITGSLVAASLGALVPAAASGAASRHDVLKFDTAFANVSPFIGAAGAIRGVTAAPLPWAIGSIHGDLDASGQLTIAVDHLVLANAPSVSANLRGTNP